MNCCPHGRRNYTCVLLPLYCTFSLTSSPLPPSHCTVGIYRQCVTVGGGGCWNVLWTIFCRSFTLCSWPDSEIYKIATPPPQTKMTSKDDIKRFMSLKFLYSYDLPLDQARGRPAENTWWTGPEPGPAHWGGGGAPGRPARDIRAHRHKCLNHSSFGNFFFQTVFFKKRPGRIRMKNTYDPLSFSVAQGIFWLSWERL